MLVDCEIYIPDPDEQFISNESSSDFEDAMADNENYHSGFFGGLLKPNHNKDNNKLSSDLYFESQSKDPLL